MRKLKNGKNNFFLVLYCIAFFSLYRHQIGPPPSRVKEYPRRIAILQAKIIPPIPVALGPADVSGFSLGAFCGSPIYSMLKK